MCGVLAQCNGGFSVDACLHGCYGDVTGGNTGGLEEGGKVKKLGGGDVVHVKHHPVGHRVPGSGQGEIIKAYRYIDLFCISTK